MCAYPPPTAPPPPPGSPLRYPNFSTIYAGGNGEVYIISPDGSIYDAKGYGRYKRDPLVAGSCFCIASA